MKEKGYLAIKQRRLNRVQETIVIAIVILIAVAKNYIDGLGGFEKFAEWGLIR